MLRLSATGCSCLFLLLFCTLALVSRASAELDGSLKQSADDSLARYDDAAFASDLESTSEVTFLESGSSVHHSMPHNAVRIRKPAKRRVERERGQCPTTYIFNAMRQECLCPIGTSGVVRGSDADAQLHRVAQPNPRCCRALGLSPECTVPCCFCLDTLVPRFHAQDCLSEVALQQATWWRRKQSEHAHVSSKVAQLRQQLERAKHEAGMHDEHMAAHDPNYAAPASFHPAGDAADLHSRSGSSLHAPPPVGVSEEHVKRDVRTLFMSSLL